MGIHLRSNKSQFLEESAETVSHFDVQLEFSEIHLLRENTTSVLGIMKAVISASVDVPMQPAVPIRAEIDVKLGGTQCNIIPSRLIPWVCLGLSRKKHMVLRDEHSHGMSETTSSKEIMWTCNVSAPEMTVVLYSLSGLSIYHVCSQSSHLFANNIASKGIAVHMELGELQLHMADEYQEFFRENIFGAESNSVSLMHEETLFAAGSNSGSFMHIDRVSLDWGNKEFESSVENDPTRWKLVFCVDITGMGVCFRFHHVESLISTVMSFKALLKRMYASGEKATPSKGVRSSESGGKGMRILKLNLQRCFVIFYGDFGVEDAIVADPKRVNFGSQGGEVIINLSADGTPRRASISSTSSIGCKHLKYSTSLDIFHFSLCLNKEKKSALMELERAKSVYQEYSEKQVSDSKMTLFEMQNAKFVRRPGGLNEIALCSFFSATDITVRWEPDVHLAVYECILRINSLLQNLKNQGLDNEINDYIVCLKNMESKKEHIVDPLPSEKHSKKGESVFAVDVEMLCVSAELADGVEALVRVESIFSENLKIGILLEGLVLSFNGARVFKSTRMQISRIPRSISNISLDAKGQMSTVWDWVIQGFDVHICMPYRLPLRAIEDAVEDMWRGLKLITSAKVNILFPSKDSVKKAKSKSSNFGSVRFNIRKLTADIEEEPIQGWLDEHYQIMKSVVCESFVRCNFFDELVSERRKAPGISEPNEPCSERKIHFNGVEIHVSDISAVERLREEIHKQAFQSYYQACQNMVLCEGSGACTRGFQAGFKPSSNRASLLSLCATELDVTLTKIEGGEIGMIEFIKKLDPVASQNDIPFSRLLGRNVVLRTASLVVQLRNYTHPIFSATAGKCEGCIVLAQQATCFQPQIEQDVYIGRWRKVRMLRSASGTTPPLKTYSDLPVFFHRGEVSFGVGYEPAFADISYAFTIALRRANLSIRKPNLDMKDQAASSSLGIININSPESKLPKKERSLPWWDDTRYYIHGKVCLCFSEIKWNLLATTNPYEKLDRLQIVSGYMEIQQTDGRVFVFAKEFKIFVSSSESLMNSCSLEIPTRVSGPFLESPAFSLEVIMDWECESGSPLNHYLHALPNEKEPRKKVYDPFRSTSLSLKWNFSLRPSINACDSEPSSSGMLESALLSEPVRGSSRKMENHYKDSPTMTVGAHDLVWIFKWWNMNYNPPYKLRSFSRWPRFGIPRAVRSGNLSLDKVMTEFMLRLDATPGCIKYMPLGTDDPASGLTFTTTKLKYELCYSRGKMRYTFECKRDPLDLVYQGLDLHVLKAYLRREQGTQIKKSSQTSDRVSNETCNRVSGTEKPRDDGFLLHSDYFTIRRQAPKADPVRLLAWQEAGRKNLEMTYVRSEFENGSESDHTRSEPSDDDGFNVVIADNCQRVFVYGLKLLWTIENRDAVWSWVGGISKAFEPPKPSPSRQYAQRKLVEEQQLIDSGETLQDNMGNTSPTLQGATSPSQNLENLGSISSPPQSSKVECASSGLAVKNGNSDCSEEEGKSHFMVNVIQPQFNLHSEDANGRFLLAAASGRVLARSFHSVLHVGYEMIERALGTSNTRIPESAPDLPWKRVEFSVMLEHVQAHVAPTDVDPGAGLQWLPKILGSSPKVKRTGALLERVFMPCTMYFRYTRHKGGTPELKMKPLKELIFNSPNISATMTSRQFQVMLDVLSNLLFARLPKPRKSSLTYPAEDDEDIEEEADEVVPDGVEEVELARIKLEQRERERKLLLDDIRTLSVSSDLPGDLFSSAEKDYDLWMITDGKSLLVQGLKKDLGNIQKSRKAAIAALRLALQKAAQLRLMEKEKNKSPSYAMRISMRIDKVEWGMFADGKPFAEAEINNMIYDFDRDYKDIGISQFTTKFFVVRNCLPKTKSDMLLSAWNPPPEWGKNVMLRVDARQGAPKDGNSPLELFHVEIYPLKIYLTETMYRMMWEYFFPEEEQDSQRRQEVWKVSTTASSRRGKKSFSLPESNPSISHTVRENDAPSKLGASAIASVAGAVSQTFAHMDTSQMSKLHNLKANMVCGSSSELRRTSSCDRTWEENVVESVANELLLQVHSSSVTSSRNGILNSGTEPQNVLNEETSKNKQKAPSLLDPVTCLMKKRKLQNYKLRRDLGLGR
ncbi:hypothetical protein QJS10_CPB17g02481 [Acorus calamus]|uniref:FMP27/BLTP2/Hobbit GFWDK motif-containing RBG unit domain-containing protein n=1 Tax=Acorus calamus TaxID=4465 RepID=A0AAV9CXA6_ACOCL|nr:hypothetical protein QJS10_CPB17g02481 [Acorus calamus]